MVIFRPSVFILRCPPDRQDAVYVSFEPYHLSVDLIAFSDPCDVRLTVSHVQGFYLCPAHQCRVDGFSFVRLVVQVDARQCAERQFVLGCCRLFVLVVQYGIVEVGRECSRTGFHYCYLILFRRIVVIGHGLCLCRRGCNYCNRHE